MLRLKSERKKGKSTMTKLNVRDLYPNFRKENSGSAGAILFSGTRTHNLTLTDSKFSKTVSRIKGGIFSF